MTCGHCKHLDATGYCARCSMTPPRHLPACKWFERRTHPADELIALVKTKPRGTHELVRLLGVEHKRLAGIVRTARKRIDGRIECLARWRDSALYGYYPPVSTREYFAEREVS